MHHLDAIHLTRNQLEHLAAMRDPRGSFLQEALPDYERFLGGVVTVGQAIRQVHDYCAKSGSELFHCAANRLDRIPDEAYFLDAVFLMLLGALNHPAPMNPWDTHAIEFLHEHRACFMKNNQAQYLAFTSAWEDAIVDFATRIRLSDCIYPASEVTKYDRDRFDVLQWWKHLVYHAYFSHRGPQLAELTIGALFLGDCWIPSLQALLTLKEQSTPYDGHDSTRVLGDLAFVSLPSMAHAEGKLGAGLTPFTLDGAVIESWSSAFLTLLDPEAIRRMRIRLEHGLRRLELDFEPTMMEFDAVYGDRSRDPLHRAAIRRFLEGYQHLLE